MKPIEKYKAQTAKVVTWEEIEEKYANLGLPFRSMLLLVKFIRNNQIDKRLFAYTSMHKLVVTIYDPPEWNRQSLHIEFNPYSKIWHFEYRPKPFEPSEAERYYPEEAGINKFCKYIELLKW